MLRLAALALLLAACGGDSDVVGPFTGTVQRFTIDRFDLPLNNTDAREFADDLDGDDHADNQLGMVIGTLNAYGNVTKHSTDMIASGALASFVEIQVDDLQNDPTVGVWYYGAEGEAATPMGGTLENGVFRSNRAATTKHPGTATLHLPVLVDIDPTLLDTGGMQIDLTPDGHGGYDGLVRGLVPLAVAREQAYAAIMAMLAAQPQDHRWFWVVVDLDRDGNIPFEEIYRDRTVMVSLLTPDIDGAISLGFRIHLSPAGTPLPAIADRCFDRIHDGSETGIDCGGECVPCGADQACSVPDDCQSGTCLTGHCTKPSCSDGQLSGFESDVDCGGPCPGCLTGKRCEFVYECAETLRCASSGTCQ